MEAGLQTAIEQLRSDQPKDQLAAAQWLAQADNTDEFALEIVEKLNQSDDSLVEWLESALESCRSPDATQLDGFLNLIQQFQQGTVRPIVAYWSVTMIGCIGASAAKATPALMEMLQRIDHPTIQFKAAWALGEIGPAASDAIPQLEQAAKNSGHPRLATFAQLALESIKPSN